MSLKVAASLKLNCIKRLPAYNLNVLIRNILLVSGKIQVVSVNDLVLVMIHYHLTFGNYLSFFVIYIYIYI